MNKDRYKNSDAKAFCVCWDKLYPWEDMGPCKCGEDVQVNEWSWQRDPNSSIKLSDDNKDVTLHPFFSSGTAVIRGDMPFKRNHHYYFEVKMLTEPYGTDIMVGVGSPKVQVHESQFAFTSLLGIDAESYGLSYTGKVYHESKISCYTDGFCRGTIIGVRVDMWHGTLEFYLNRIPTGITFYNLRKHPVLFPMISSTSAQSSLRLIYATSWPASLLVDSAKVLSLRMAPPKSNQQMEAGNNDIRPASPISVPPGLWHLLNGHFWLILPTDGNGSNLGASSCIRKQRLPPLQTVLGAAPGLDPLFTYMNALART